MCGRFLISSPLEGVRDWFNPASIAPVPPNDNAAPTQNLGVLAYGPDKRLHVAAMQWGLVPAWAQEAKGSAININARSETIFEKPSFREAVRTRRCLVPANGFYEWNPEDKEKTPYLVSWPNQPLFFFAGVWEIWAKGQHPLYSFAIVTRDANPSIGQIHHRMPIMITAEQGRDWLDTQQPERTLDQLSFQTAQVQFRVEAVDKSVTAIKRATAPKKQASLF